MKIGETTRKATSVASVRFSPFVCLFYCVMRQVLSSNLGVQSLKIRQVNEGVSLSIN